MTTSKPVKVEEFYELEVGSDLETSSFYNDDLAPTKIKERTWSKLNIAALWVGMSICVPTYT